MEKYILTKPIAYEGETYKEINFDLDGLSRKDMDRAEKFTRTKHGKALITVVELNKTYQMFLASIAADVPPGVLSEKHLGAKDYPRISLMVQDFLLGGESEAGEEEAMEQLMEYLQESGRMKNGKKKGAPPTNPPTNPPA